MGIHISKVFRDEEGKGPSESLEKLKLLKETMANKVAASSAIMRGKALEDESLPVAAIVDTSEMYSVNVKNTVSAVDVECVVRENVDGEFIDDFVKVLTFNINLFLKGSEAGASEKRDFHVIFSNNTLLRVDLTMYKYQFSSIGSGKAEFQNGFCYSFQTAVLDAKKVNPQVLLYELTRAIGLKNLCLAVKKLHYMSNFGVVLYRAINKMSRAAEEGGKDSACNAFEEFELKIEEDASKPEEEEEEKDDANEEKHSG